MLLKECNLKKAITDSFVSVTLDYDKRNQRYRTSEGFRSTYNIDMPILSDNYTLTNSYDFKKYTSLYDNNTTSFTFFYKVPTQLQAKTLNYQKDFFYLQKN